MEYFTLNNGVKMPAIGFGVFQIPKEEMAQGTLFIEIPQALLKNDKTEVQLEIYNGEILIDQTKTNFMGPRSFN